MIVEMDSNIMKYKEYCFYSIHRITVPINEILTKEDNISVLPGDTRELLFCETLLKLIGNSIFQSELIFFTMVT